MKYIINKESSTAVYMQLFNEIKEDILSGCLRQGEKLPSKRFMASELGISIITVEHAYELLADEGYIATKERSGYYVDFGGEGTGQRPKRAEIADMSAELKPMEDFPFSLFAKTMRKVLGDYNRRILIKSPNCGCMELREAISGYLQRSRGLMVSPEQIIIGSGAEYLYSMVVQLLGRERLFALEDPSYEKIRQVYEANGAKCRMLKLGEEGILSSELSECRAGVLHVTPFHSYPSGVTATAAKRREYAQWAKDRGSFIVEDDYDSEFATSRRQIETIYSTEPERVIYLNSFSKIIAPSVRTGFMLLPENLMDEYNKKLNFYSCTVPIYDQYVLAEFINAGHMERYINRRKRKQKQSST